MTSSPWAHRAVASVAVVTGLSLLGLSAGGVRSVDAQLRAADRAPVTTEQPVVLHQRDGGTPADCPRPSRTRDTSTDPDIDAPATPAPAAGPEL